MDNNEALALLIELQKLLTPEQKAQFDQATGLAKPLVADHPQIKPQEGPQTAFFNTTADIAICGGSAGGGKSFSLSIEPLKHIDNPEFGCIVFRRTYKQISNEGSIWDESEKWYPKAGGKPTKSDFVWDFPSGARISFRHMEHDKDLDDYMSAQIALLIIDQVEQFTETAFWGLVGRNRSTCGIKPYCRAACNPSPGSWLAELLEWWIDQETGFPILERSGVIRWMARSRHSDEIFWGDSKESLMIDHPEEEWNPEHDMLSLTFIPSKVEDNKIRMAADPGYIAKLRMEGYVRRMQLLYGNWKVTVADGLFNTSKITIIPIMPATPTRLIYVDKAGVSEIIKKNKPSWTVMALVAKSGRFFIVEDVVYLQREHRERNQAIKNFVTVINSEFGYVPTWVEVEPGSGGKESSQISIEEMIGYDVRLDKVDKNKIDRAGSFASYVEAGLVQFLNGSWNRVVMEAMAIAPNGTMKDLWDCIVGGFNKLALEGGGTGGQQIIYTGGQGDGVLSTLDPNIFR